MSEEYEDEYEDHPDIPGMTPEMNQALGMNRQVIMQYSNEHLQYLRSITDDDTFSMICQWLGNAKLKVKTLNDLLVLIGEAFSQEYILNHYPGFSWYRRYRIIFRSKLLRFPVSAVEAKYLDIDLILKIVEEHHMNKMLRSVNGFEREIQHTSIYKGQQENRQSMENRQEPKTGLNRWIGGGGNQ